MTRSHTADTNHDRLAVQSKQELLSSEDPRGFFFFLVFFYSVTPPANAICLFLSEIRTSRCVSCLCVVFRWASQRRPSVTQAFFFVAAMLLADCCLQPNPAVWRNVKYSLLNCQARAGWEPCQAFTVASIGCPPPTLLQPTSNTTQPNQPLFLQLFKNQTSLLPSFCHTPTS